MIKLTHTEAFVLDLIHKKKFDFSACLKIYAYSYLDHFESKSTLSVEDFLKKSWMQESLLLEAILTLKKSKFLTKKETAVFNAFSLSNFEPVKAAHLKEGENTKDIKAFNNVFFHFFEKYDHKGTKYELRYFWPQHYVPEFVDFGSGLFAPESYSYKTNEDIYWINESGVNLKVRDNELHIKECFQNINGICQFSKKKKLPLQNSFFDAQNFESVVVRKKRYMRKFADKTKIELGLIELQGHEWKTICVESKSLETVLALSLFINPEHAEKLSYADFLHKYGRP